MEQRTATANLSAEDKTFIETAYKGGLAEIKEVQLAQQKAADPQVRKTASQLQKEHEALNSELSRIGSRYGVALPKEPSPERQALYQKLQKLSGDDFDKQFLKAGAEAHQKTIALFERTESASPNPEIKTLAGDTLPTLKKHLSMLKDLQAHEGKAHSSSY
jgi:putative membrane protein